MKRHGFGGQPASHGQSLMHRGMGSAGGSQGSGSRVLPGKRMPGRMGNESVTVKNLKVLSVDEKNGILVVNGKCQATFSINSGDFTNVMQAVYRDQRTNLFGSMMRVASLGQKAP